MQGSFKELAPRERQLKRSVFTVQNYARISVKLFNELGSLCNRIIINKTFRNQVLDPEASYFACMIGKDALTEIKITSVRFGS